MTHDAIIVRYGEIGIKGKNRKDFEIKLKNNIIDYFQKNQIPYSKIILPRGRLIIFTDKKANLKQIFGIVSYSYAKTADPTIESIKNTLPLNIQSPFRVTASRLDKNNNLHSDQICKDIGAYIVKKTNADVNLKKYKTNIIIEIVDNRAFIMNNKIQGFGGLPVGIEGEAFVQITDKKSELAGILCMKRGVAVHCDKPCLIQKYAYGYKIKNTAKIKISGETIEELDNIQNNKFILRPLVGYTKKQTEELYNKFGDNNEINQ